MYLTSHKNLLTYIFLLISVTGLFSSCSILQKTVVRNAPVNRPFVFTNKITINGNVSKDEKNRLTTELYNYWDDSLKVRKVQQFGIIYKIKNPAVFDSANIARSETFMNAYLNSQGYYYATFADSVYIDTTQEGQMRANVEMNINIGKNITIDSVSFDMGDSTLQKLTETRKANTYLKKGVPYTKSLISNELDRLVGLYRQNGYYHFTREDIYAEADTTNPRLLELTLDPFKQAQIIADAAKIRRENPTWNIKILKRPTVDSSKLIQYHIGKMYFYPETRLTDIIDSIPSRTDYTEETHRSLVMRYKKGLFNYRPLREHTYMRSGDLYNESAYFKSINTLGQLGAWQQVDGKPVIRDKDSLDMYFFLVPAIKQNYTIDLEGSRNTADFGFGNLWGLSTNLTYNNKNVWKRAIQSVTTFRTGVELNILTGNQSSLLQTFLIDAGHTYVFPKLVQPFKNWRALNRLENKRTLFSVNGSYTNRRDYYQLRSFTTGWGYEWKKGNNIWLYKPLNLELYSIDTLAGLRNLFASNPFLRTSFNSGKVLSQSLTFNRNTISDRNPDKTNYIRLGIEEAGGLFGLIGGLKNQIYRYLKVEAEFRQTISIRKTVLAYRAFAGIGYNYGSDTARDKTLPFFKQFTAGGPYSMRAWSLRQLGLGSSIQSDVDTSKNAYRDRFGDMQLEANIEYRFPFLSVGGVNIGSALYADIGNIWNLKYNPQDPESQFKLENLYRDLAIGVGTGLRIDFSYFLIRFDLAYKLKDPARAYNNGWAKEFTWSEYRANGLKINNVAFQLGIGLPF